MMKNPRLRSRTCRPESQISYLGAIQRVENNCTLYTTGLRVRLCRHCCLKTRASDPRIESALCSLEERDIEQGSSISLTCVYA